MKKGLWLAMAAALFFGAAVQPASAFSDLEGTSHAEKIIQLKKAGILKGEADGKFHPEGELSAAAGVTMIVSAMDLSLAKFLFVKAPKASDYFTKADDGAWYADVLTIAHVNGVGLPKDLNPGTSLTREEFAHYLYRGIGANGEHPFTAVHFELKDGKDISPAYEGSIQTLLNGGIDMLDKENRFRPKEKITRAEAAGWLYDAYSLVSRANSAFIDIGFSEGAADKGMREVTVRAQVPHPGYGLQIMDVTYEEGRAIISYQALLPDPDKMYPQVVTDVSAKVKIKAGYKPVLREMPPVFAE